MDDTTKQKIFAGAKIGFGAARMASAVATAAGVGIVGGFMRSHHMMAQTGPLAKQAFMGGKRMFDEGRVEWKQAQ